MAQASLVCGSPILEMIGQSVMGISCFCCESVSRWEELRDSAWF